MLLVTFLTLMGLLLVGLPVAAALFLLALVLAGLYSGVPVLRALESVAWAVSTDFIIVAIPLFVLLGEILLRSGVAERAYDALDNWLSWMPGGLMHANIGAATIFSATSGSSVATAATIGTIALPQARRFGYNEQLFAGSIAAGGTLGILIPPSINLIVYGFLTQTSIPQLFLAGILPGLLMALMFAFIVLIACSVVPSWGGEKRALTPRRDRVSKLRHLIPIALLFLVVIGSIYAGLATPTEAAALGVLFALVLAAFYRGLNLGMMREALEGTLRTTAMIMLILIAANFLNFVLANIGLTRSLGAFLDGLSLSPFQTLVLIIGLYILLGFFIETLSLMIVTIPIVTPIVFGLGYDPVWFGILLIVLIEMALITPPVGLNLYVVQSVRQRGRLSDVMIGAVPFALVMLLVVALLVAFPDIALLLPNLASD